MKPRIGCNESASSTQVCCCWHLPRLSIPVEQFFFRARLVAAAVQCTHSYARESAASSTHTRGPSDAEHASHLPTAVVLSVGARRCARDAVPYRRQHGHPHSEGHGPTLSRGDSRRHEHGCAHARPPSLTAGMESQRRQALHGEPRSPTTGVPAMDAQRRAPIERAADGRLALGCELLEQARRFSANI